MKHPQQNANALLRDSRRRSWIMTMPSAYFILENGRDVRLASCRACPLSTAQEPVRGSAARRWLGGVGTWAAIGVALGLLYTGLWWMVEKLVAALL